MSVLSLVSKVLAVEDAVAVVQYLVSLHTQMEILAHIAHVEQFFVMLLQQSSSDLSYTGLIQR